MSIDSHRLPAIIQNNVLIDEPRAGRKLRWRGVIPYIEDSRPKLSPMVKNNHLKNRWKVYCGDIVSVSENGEVAIVRDEQGNEAAFWNFELIESPATAGKYQCYSCKGWFDHSDVCPSNTLCDYLYCRICHPSERYDAIVNATN